MSKPHTPTSAAERYDYALLNSHNHKLPPGYLLPKPTNQWPPENIALLKRFQEWLVSGGASPEVINRLYIPVAGFALGYALKPHPQIDLETDLTPALEYVKAKRPGPDWLKVSRIALERFRRFLQQERGQVETKPISFKPEQQAAGLPEWLVQELERYQHIMQRNWRPARLGENIERFWSGHLRLWRFLVEHSGVMVLSDVRRQHLYDYIDQRLVSGHSVSGINNDLRQFHSLLAFLQEQGYTVPQALLHFPCLQQPDPLPKFLTDEQVRLLREDLEKQVAQSRPPNQHRDALLDRAAFYLLWQSGLRLGEVEELRLDDLDLAGRKLVVRHGKGMKDRTVFMTHATLQALQAYLAQRGMGPTDHVFLYRNQPLHKDLVRARIKYAGQRVGVKVYPHRLRHTCATQLLNAGCRITSIQKFLGHQRLNSTMIYARVHDQTVADDYYAAMQQVEKRLELLGAQYLPNPPVSEDERGELLVLTDQLAEPELGLDARLMIVAQMRWVLSGKEPAYQDPLIENCGRRLWEHPPPSPAVLGAVLV